MTHCWHFGNNTLEGYKCLLLILKPLHWNICHLHVDLTGQVNAHHCTVSYFYCDGARIIVKGDTYKTTAKWLQWLKSSVWNYECPSVLQQIVKVIVPEWLSCKRLFSRSVCQYMTKKYMPGISLDLDSKVAPHIPLASRTVMKTFERYSERVC